MVKHFRKILSDRNKSAKVITICNYKGGVGKSTTAAILAQGLSQRGLDVLAIDLDAQGSLTNLFGCLPDFDISDDKTVLPLFLGQKNNLEESVLKTYWDGVDLIGASPLLHSAEFLMPDIILKSNDGKSKWNTLNEGLTSLRDKYDVIIIDTPPSLSFGTLNAIFAANALVMPLPPSPLDFLSSAQFWSSCDEAIDNFKISDGVSKEFDFINILINRADYTSPVSVSVREWIIKTYGSRVLASEIPKTSIADTASSEFGTIFDLDPARSIRKSYKRALLAYDLFVDTVDRQIQASNKSNSENKEKA
jgi:chromosome partitioning protein